jgi:hypothetical protein
VSPLKSIPQTIVFRFYGARFLYTKCHSYIRISLQNMMKDDIHKTEECFTIL